MHKQPKTSANVTFTQKQTLVLHNYLYYGNVFSRISLLKLILFLTVFRYLKMHQKLFQKSKAYVDQVETKLEELRNCPRSLVYFQVSV